MEYEKTFGDYIVLGLLKIVELLFFLNYIWGDPRYERNADGVIERTPLAQLGGPYFHRCTLRSCGCGYDGCYIYPSQCARLAEDIRTGTYPGY